MRNDFSPFAEPSELLQRAVDPNRRTRRTNTNLGLLQELIDHDIIEVEEQNIEKQPLTADTVEDYRNFTPAGSAKKETDEHVRLKIRSARYLAETGHEVGECWNPSGKPNTPPTLYNSFEEKRTFGIADVVCEDCRTVVECGTLTKNKVINALGLERLRAPIASREPYTLILVPYTQNAPGNDELTMFTFRVVGDPQDHEAVGDENTKSNIIAEELGDAFD